MTEPNGADHRVSNDDQPELITTRNQYSVIIRTWSCPISWHRYVKWHGSDAYCQEPGCGRSNVEPSTPYQPARMVAPVPRGVVTIHLPDKE